MTNVKRCFFLALVLSSAGCTMSGSGLNYAGYAQRPVPRVIQSSPPSAWVEFQVPSNDSCPNGIATGSDKRIWFADFCANSIGRVTTDGRFARFKLPANTYPAEIASGAPGVLWFTGEGPNATGDIVGKITTSGSISLYTTPTAHSGPVGITQGPDGAMWFTEWSAAKIGRIDDSGNIREFSLPPDGYNPEGITTGPDGALWFAEFSRPRVGRITTDGTVTEINVGADTAFIAPGGDGNLWATENTADAVARISPAGVVTTFPVRRGNPFVIVRGPHGNPWFTVGGKTLQHFDLASGRLAPADIDPNYSSTPEALTVGPDGNIWFAELQTGRIGVYVRHRQTATPSTITFSSVGQMQTFSVVERLYSGTFSATGCDPSIATVTPTRGATTFTVTATGPGACDITVRDSMRNESLVTVEVDLD